MSTEPSNLRPVTISPSPDPFLMGFVVPVHTLPGSGGQHGLLTCTVCGCTVDAQWWRNHRERCHP